MRMERLLMKKLVLGFGSLDNYLNEVGVSF